MFETEAAARMFAKENDINDYMITSDGKGRYILTIIGGEFDGQQFYDSANYELLPEMEIQSGGSHSNSGFEGDMSWSNGILGGAFNR